MNKFGITGSITVGEMHPLFKGIKWVLSARSSDETREIIMRMKVEREGLDYHLIATDGRRLHVSTFDPGMFDDDIDVLDPGLYEMIATGTKYIVLAKCEVFEAERYPNWRAVMPDDVSTPFSERVSSDRLSFITLRTGAILANSFACAAAGFGTCFKKDELASIRFGQSDPDGPVVIKHEFGRAIVMPIRISDETDQEESSDEEQTPDIPEVVSALDPLMAAMEEGDSLTISVGGKEVKTINQNKK